MSLWLGLNFSVNRRSERKPSAYWPKHSDLFFPPICWVFLVPNSVHRNILVTCCPFETRILPWFDSSGISPFAELPCTWPVQGTRTDSKQIGFVYSSLIYELKMKSFSLYAKLFQRTKRCAGKIPVYGGKNEISQLTEKKPAYDSIKNYGQ